MIDLWKRCLIGLSMCVTACAGSEDAAHQQLPSQGTVTVNGIDFEYWVEGSGIPCLVVGGALIPSRALSDDLKETFRFVFVSSRMTMREDEVGDVGAVTMDTLVSDIDGVRQFLGLERVCVLGHSIAGILAVEYARRYPDHTACAIMHATPPYGNERGDAERERFWNENASPDRKRALAENWAALGEDSLSKLSPSDAGIREYITDAPRYFYDPEYDPEWLLEGEYWNMSAWARFFDVIMAEYDLGDEPQVRTPVFLAIGREDYAVPFTLWGSERSKIQDLSYNLFERSGHYAMLEESDLFDRALVDWIQTIER